MVSCLVIHVYYMVTSRLTTKGPLIGGKLMVNSCCVSHQLRGSNCAWQVLHAGVPTGALGWSWRLLLVVEPLKNRCVNHPTFCFYTSENRKCLKPPSSLIVGQLMVDNVWYANRLQASWNDRTMVKDGHSMVIIVDIGNECLLMMVHTNLSWLSLAEWLYNGLYDGW